VTRLVLDGQSLITPEAIATELVAAQADLDGTALAEGKAELALVLSVAHRQFEHGKDPVSVIDKLIGQLHRMRGRLDPVVWRALLPVAQTHPVSDFFLQDPFTRWSFEKPRGYSGDAQLLDFIYGHSSVEEEIAAATSLGKAIYGYTKHASAPVAVRERRDLLTVYVDEIAAARGSDTEILTIAAGHLREANGSTALYEGRLKRWIALDQDPLSIGSITRDFRGTSVEAIDGSVRGLLSGRYKLGQFDFIYSAGLYDYLSHGIAVKLTQKCLQMLKPDGVLLFANFADEIPVDGYMETFMNWALLLRSEADMWDIINASVDRNVVDASVYFGANRNIVYGVIERRGLNEPAPVRRRAGAADRFEIMKEPTDQWLVWDNATDLPAEHDDVALFGLSYSEALIHCRQLNRNWLSH
jgi:SAM-dependent methyltransferase